MTAEIKSLFDAIQKDPEFITENEDKIEAAWEAAWKRYRQTKRNEKALKLVKHEKEKFHTHSKFGKIFKPITNYNNDILAVDNEKKEVLNKQDYLMTGEKEGYPKFQGKIGSPSKFPPEQVKEFLEYKYNETKPYYELPPKTALERLKKIKAEKEKI